MNQIYCKSSDGEYYNGSYESREEALAEGEQDAYNDNPPETDVTIYTGIQQGIPEVLRKYAERIGEHAIECAEDHAALDIAADDTMIEVPAEKHAELGEVIVKWLEANASFKVWGVTNTLAHPYTTPPEEPGIMNHPSSTAEGA